MDRAVRKQIETQGACTEADWELFVTEKPAYQNKAKAICSTCPVREVCAKEYWFETGTVVGGLTSRERNARTLALDIPHLSHARLVDSVSRGGVRALMIEGNLTENEALRVEKLLEQGAQSGRKVDNRPGNQRNR
jgi:hypothetical protein